MAKRLYKIGAKLVFRGEFAVLASNIAQAEEKIRTAVGCKLGSVQTSSNDIDWKFPLHGDIEFNRGREEEQGNE